MSEEASIEEQMVLECKQKVRDGRKVIWAHKALSVEESGCFGMKTSQVEGQGPRAP